ncbi:MAG: glycosyltransferase [Planctomycetota bacterium]
MHLILLHGYLLQGTGSNIYVANVAQAWRDQGHGVTVVCQEPDAAALPFVDEAFLPGGKLPRKRPRARRVRVVVPDIERLLPVYVFDRYEGYEVKRIPDLTPEEVERHVTLTAQALRKAARLGARRVLANHVLLGPLIARRALKGTGVPYDVKVHGSALEYTLVPNPHLLPYAVEGLAGAERIYAGTRHVRERVLEVFSGRSEEIGLDHKLHVVPPGMDPEVFAPARHPAQSRVRFRETVARKIEERPNGRTARPGCSWPPPGNTTSGRPTPTCCSGGPTCAPRSRPSATSASCSAPRGWGSC